MSFQKALFSACMSLSMVSAATAQEISLKDPNSPYAQRSCKLTHYLNHKTSLPADCRCNSNQTSYDGINVCKRPATLAKSNIEIGSGPSFKNYYNAHLSGGFIDYGRNELITSVYWGGTSDPKGLVVAYNLDNWTRRFVSGDIKSEWNAASTGKGMPFAHLYDIKPGPDGNWYTLSYQPQRLQIFRVNPDTGERSLVWNAKDSAYGQCSSGKNNPQNDTQKYVQYRQHGFAVDPDDGSFLLGYNNARLGGVGIVRISPDSKYCDFVTMSGKRDDGLSRGQGQPMRGSIQGFTFHEGNIYAHSTLEKTFWMIEPDTGNRTVLSRSPVGERHIVWDNKRQVFWTAGTNNAATIAAYDPQLDKYLDTKRSCGKDWDWFPVCRGGPIKIDTLNYGPMFLNTKTGNLLFGHDAIAIIEFEPETGNSIVRSL
ncbi:MAG: hypothetical protein OIF57_03030 [Marinobacterium sp.]|nr:hypothetical protein [Marinobacterium sp.]